MVDFDGQVCPVVVASELRSWHLSLLECSALGRWRLEWRLLLQRRRSSASSASHFLLFLQGARQRHLKIRLMSFLLQLLLGQVIGGEITEGRMWILGGVFVLPGLV